MGLFDIYLPPSIGSVCHMPVCRYRPSKALFVFIWKGYRFLQEKCLLHVTLQYILMMSDCTLIRKLCLSASYIFKVFDYNICCNLPNSFPWLPLTLYDKVDPEGSRSSHSYQILQKKSPNLLDIQAWILSLAKELPLALELVATQH